MSGKSNSHLLISIWEWPFSFLVVSHVPAETRFRSLEIARGLLGLVSGNGTDNAVLLALEPVSEAGGQRTAHGTTAGQTLRRRGEWRLEIGGCESENAAPVRRGDGAACALNI